MCKFYTHVEWSEKIDFKKDQAKCKKICHLESRCISHDNCALCKQKKTIENLIQCPNPSQDEWQIKYVSKLQRKLGSTNTKDALTMYLCTMITNWMDTGMVLAENFPNKYSRAIYSQHSIGWDK